MSTVKVNVENLHFEHTLWRNELSFFQDEVNIYEKYLEKLVNAGEDREVLVDLEQYQNQFIRQKEVLDQLQHDIKVHDQELGKMLQREEDPTEADLIRHNKVGDQMETFRKIYGELKSKFLEFMAENNFNIKN
jgi:seryl-tRNA synthetase